MRSSVAKSMLRAAEADENLFLISGDAGYGVLDEHQARFGSRYLNLGVAEQNTISFAAGLALVGYRVFVYNIIPFVLYRCYEQVRNDICYQHLPVILVGTGSGVAYAPAGMTHYGVEDIALARTLPGLTILSPCDPYEAELCVDFALKAPGPSYIRIAKAKEPVLHTQRPTSITEPLVHQQGEGVAVVFHGSVGDAVLEAVKGLEPRPTVLSVPMLQPMDLEALGRRLAGIHTVLTVEEHCSTGGLGSIVAQWIADERRPLRLERMGFGHEFIHAVCHTAGMRELYGFSAPQIAAAVRRAFETA